MTVDPDEGRLFTAREVHQYNPRPCPDCGQITLVYSFLDVTPDDEGRIYLRGTPECGNPDCSTRTP